MELVGITARDERMVPRLPHRRGPLLQVDEMGLDPPLGEETERLPGVGALPDAEDLDFHC